MAACISDEGFLRAFIAMFDTAFDGLAVETVACLEEFARTHPHYTALVNAHAFEPATVDRTALAEISHDGINKIWGCMTDAEVEHSLAIFINASDQTPASGPPEPPAPLVESAGSLEDLFVTDATTGRDIMARLSQPERDCIRAAMGEPWYRALLDLSMARIIRETGDAGAASIMGCLTDDNVVLLGLVVIDAHYGRIDPEARACRIAVGRESPVVVHVMFGSILPPFEAVDTAALLASTKELFDCLAVADQASVLVGITAGLARQDTFTGAEIVEMLPEEEASCIRDGVGDELFEAFLSATVTAAFAPAAPLLDCLTLESKTALFAAFTASRVGGLREEAVTCIATVGADLPHVLALGFGTLDIDALEESDLAGLGNEALRLFDCLSPEEVYQVLTLPAASGQ